MDDHTSLDAEYAEDLRRIVRKWRISHHRHMKRADKVGLAVPVMTDPVSDGLIRCAWVLVHAYSGAHHVGTVKIGSGDGWIAVTHFSEIATADSDLMTRLVLLAHDAAVRVSVQPSSPRNLRIMLHPRVRSDRNMTNHRTMENAVESLRKVWAPVPVAIPVVTPETDKG